MMSISQILGNRTTAFRGQEAKREARQDGTYSRASVTAQATQDTIHYRARDGGTVAITAASISIISIAAATVAAVAVSKVTPASISASSMAVSAHRTSPHPVPTRRMTAATTGCMASSKRVRREGYTSKSDRGNNNDCFIKHVEPLSMS
jgi:hypothetical protein